MQVTDRYKIQRKEKSLEVKRKCASYHVIMSKGARETE